MDWDAAGAIGELIAAAAVIVTLVYLSRQIRENSRQLSQTSLTDINGLYNEAFMPVYNSENSMRIWITGLEAPESLEPVELQIFLLYMTRLMAAFDTLVEHYQLGTVSDERFDQHRSFTVNFLKSPGGQAWNASEQYKLSVAARDLISSDTS